MLSQHIIHVFLWAVVRFYADELVLLADAEHLRVVNMSMCGAGMEKKDWGWTWGKSRLNALSVVIGQVRWWSTEIAHVVFAVNDFGLTLSIVVVYLMLCMYSKFAVASRTDWSVSVTVVDGLKCTINAKVGMLYFNKFVNKCNNIYWNKVDTGIDPLLLQYETKVSMRLSLQTASHIIDINIKNIIQCI